MAKQVHSETLKFTPREWGNLNLLAADIHDHLGQSLTINEMLRKLIEVGFNVHMQAIQSAIAEKAAQANDSGAGDNGGATDEVQPQEGVDTGALANQDNSTSEAPATGSGLVDAAGNPVTRSAEG